MIHILYTVTRENKVVPFVFTFLAHSNICLGRVIFFMQERVVDFGQTVVGSRVILLVHLQFIGFGVYFGFGHTELI